MVDWLRRLGRAERVTLGLSLAWAAACVGPGHVWFVHLVHPVALGAGFTWAAILGYRVIQAARAEHALQGLSRPATIHGIACRVLRSGGNASFALGGIRAQVYVAQGTLDRLDSDEVAAVLLHEEHHRRTMAPLRAAAVESLLMLAGWIPFVRTAGRQRIIGLEIGADRWALQHGARAPVIAAALLKETGGPSEPLGAAFAGAADARVHWLAASAEGRGATPSTLPWEWAPIVFTLVPLAACLAAMSLG